MTVLLLKHNLDVLHETIFKGNVLFSFRVSSQFLIIKIQIHHCYQKTHSSFIICFPSQYIDLSLYLKFNVPPLRNRIPKANFVLNLMVRCQFSFTNKLPFAYSKTFTVLDLVNVSGELEHIKVVIRIRKSKNRQHNAKKKRTKGQTSIFKTYR
jgi:hypothetical protein